MSDIKTEEKPRPSKFNETKKMIVKKVAGKITWIDPDDPEIKPVNNSDK